MSPETSPVIEKIIAATIECMNQGGLEDLTTRRIAQQAGVNSAAVNYYFGSKEKLVEKALTRAMGEMGAMPEEILGDESLEPMARVRLLFISLIEGVLHYPGIVRAQIYAPLMQGDQEAPFISAFVTFLNEAADRIQGLGIRSREGEIRTILIQAVSAALFSAMMPAMFMKFTGTDLLDPHVRDDYVSLLVSKYFE